MREIAAASLPFARRLSSSTKGIRRWPRPKAIAELLALYDQASRDLGVGPVTAVSPDRAGAADVSFVAGYVKMIIDGVGLMGHERSHPKETADLTTLPSQTKRAAIMLHRISRGL